MEYGFLPQGALKELNGTTAGYYYVQQAQYDAAGLLDLQKLGAASLAANPLLSRDYSYYTWTETVGGIGQGGGLKSLTSQASLTQQNLSYTYDKTDNITSIVDAVAGETMNYTYDTLNRLTGASGAQSESYDYNATTGNLATKNGASYNYGDGNHDHAVTSLSTGATFVYDLTGNMTERKVNGQGYAYTYDAENRLTGAASEDLFANGFESGSFSAWSSSVTDGGDLSVTGAAALEGSWGMQAVIDDNNSIYVTDQTPQDKTAYTASFRYDPNSIGMGSRELFTLLAGYRDDNALTFELQQYYASGSRKLRAVLYLDSGSTSTTSDYTITDAPHTVQVEWQAATGAGANNGSLKLTIDGQLKQTLSGKDNDTRQVDYLRLGAVAGIDNSTRGTLYLDDFRSWDPTAVVLAQFHYDGDGRRVQSVVNGVTTAFVGQYFEWTGSTSTMKKYYYFGVQRVAVRDGSGAGTTGLSWLLTDHLGSTTVTLDAAGAKNAEKRYKPWGEERFTFGTLPTQYTYTGQYSHTAQFGLMFYNVRWFDPLLGRFSQPDTIIPDTGFRIAWDRYAGMANNPIRFSDPTGHRPDDGCRYEGCSLTQKEIDENEQKLAILEHKVQEQKCSNGNANFCSGWSNSREKLIIGFHAGGVTTWDAGYGGYAYSQSDYLFDFGSGTLFVTKTNGEGKYLGVPNGVALEGYFGITNVHGIPSSATPDQVSDLLAGPNLDFAGDIGFDLIPDLETNGGNGLSIDINPNTGKPYITSAGPMYATENKIGVGVSILPLPIDGGIQYGQSETVTTLFYQLPFWLFR